MGSSWYYCFGSSPFQDTMKEPTLSTTQVQDLSVEWGDNVYQNLPYIYEGTFYDDSDGSFIYTNAKIEFTYIPNSIVNNEYTITENFTNSETKNPNEISDLTFYENTTVYDSTKMVSDDNAYSYFDREGLGVYNATYTFTDDNVGSDPANWTIGDETGGSINVVYELDGHNKVLDLNDINTNILNIYNNFTPQLDGTVEWWWHTDDSSKASYVSLKDMEHGKETSILLQINVGVLKYYLGTYIPIMDFESNRWYHLKIYFLIGTGWDLWVDGYQYLNDIAFQSGTTQLDGMYLHTSSTSSGFSAYYDAIDYSWAAGYIQNRSAEVLYSFEHYPATYSFENETVYSGGTDIDFIDAATLFDGACRIVTSWQSYRKVLRLTDDATVAEDPLVKHYEIQSTSGDREFWVSTNDVTDEWHFYFYEDGHDYIVRLRITSSNLQYKDNADVWQTIQAVSNNIWYHIRVSWRADNTFDVYVDGVKQVNNQATNNNQASGIDEFHLQGQGDSEDHLYLDAYGDPNNDANYKIGDNAFWHYYYDQDSNFENENCGTSGTSISWIDEQGANVDSEIIPVFNEHKKVVKFTATAGSGVIVDSGLSLEGGIVEFWVYLLQTNERLEFHIYDADYDGVYLMWHEDGNLKYYDTDYRTIETYSANTWYHVRVEWTNGEDWHLWIDNVQKDSGGYDFYNGLTMGTITQIYFYWNDITGVAHIDAISYSWSTGNEEGDNLRCNIEMFTNFTIDLSFSLYNIKDIIHVSVDSKHFTSISTNMTLSILNWSSSSWIQISNTRDISETLHEFDYTDFLAITDLISSNGTIRVKYYGFNCSAFNLKIDKLTVSIYFKTTLEYEHTLQLLGTWKYRFKLDVGLGSSYNSSWVYFNVIQQQPNFEGISESKYTTKWVLTSTETTGYTTPVFFDGLMSNSWRLSDYSSRLLSMSEGILPSDDTMISEGYPDTNYDGSSTYRLAVGDSGSLQETRALVKYEFFDNYLTENITQNSKLDIYIVSALATIDVPLQIYKTGDFEEESAIWNNQPSTGDYITTVSIDDTDGKWYTDIDLGSPYEYYKWIDGNQGDSYWCKPNHHESGTSPILYHYISKIYHNTTGEGYAYMQTDTTETLGLKSQIYSQNYSLNEGDYFTVDLETTSSNAQLKLYSNDVLQDVINVLVANTETSRQEIEVNVDSDVNFDQIKITSELDDTEYLKLYDIQAKHWIFESEADQKSMYVEPFGQNEILINYGNNTLKIYENDILQVDTYINIGYELITYVFESPLPETVFISFYDSDNEYLDFNRFKVYVNYTLYEEEFTNQRLTSREFYVDEESTIYFNIYDSFDSKIYSTGRLAKTLMDIILPVYSLKIKNEATKETSYTLTKGSISKSGWVFPEEIIEYTIATGTYQLDYINYEDMSLNTYNFNLTENKFIIINTTYFSVYFSIFNFDGLGLDKDLVRFYINNVRKDFGFNTLKQDINNLVVLDYFNATLFNQNINLRAYTEYNINVDVYTLILYNNYSYPVKIELERNNIEIEQIIPSHSGLSYRFLPNVEYEFRIYYLNETLIEEKEIELDSNNKVISFGFYEEEISEFPEFNVTNTWLMLIIIVLSFISIIIVISYFVWKYHKQHQNLSKIYVRQQNVDRDIIKNFTGGKRVK